MNRVCQDFEALIRQPESRIDVKMTLNSISKLLERCQEAQNAVEAVITDDDEIEKETQRLMDFEREIRSARRNITKMFLQIELHPEDRDVTRFVWRKQGEEMQRIYRFCRLPFGLCCSPFLAMSAVQDLAVNHRTEYTETATEVLRNMYVDDILLSCDDESTAQKMVAELTKLLKIGSFELSKWSSNCTDVLSSTPQTEVTTNCSKALGMNWEHSTDTFQFPVPSETKILLQRLWQQGIDWDETLPPPEESMWQNRRSEIMSLSRIRVLRCITPEKPRRKFELHAFCDASESAYGSVVYRRTVHIDGEISSRIIMSKSRVPLVKRVTIPRLELLEALVSARLVTYVGKELSLKIDEIVCWSDSEVALSWIKSPAVKWKSFVRNRVESIQQLTEASVWRYCPTGENPAGMLSRGCNLKRLEESQLWWEGPPWLSLPVENWPKKSMRVDQSKNTSSAEARNKITTLAVSVIEKNDRLDPSRFSNFEKLVRVTAFCFRFFRNLQLSRHEREFAELTVEELDKAENFWLLTVQREAFEKELAAVQSGRNPEGKLARFNPYLDENGLLRVRGRLQNADMDAERKHLILLPSTYPVVMLLIKRVHERSLHADTEQTLTDLRQRFWVLKDQELRDLFSENQWSEIRDALTVNRIKWKYITERTPWNGGYWERIVQTVKELLKKVLGNTRLEEDELRTVLCEIEARINSKPLNFVGDDPNDPNPLTPFHFLIGREYRNVHNIPHGEGNDPTYGAPTTKELSRRWKYRRTLVDNLWKRWKSEYVVNLSQRKKWTKSKQEPHVGDIVLVSEDDVLTHMWPMARIIEVYPGRDGVVRTVKVKTLKRSIRIKERTIDQTYKERSQSFTG
ncbi:hypothetical protein T02_2473 [Trichinella nativa]|uniref:DUF5641 domain-containing protein n=1 Tax=Trichinella nativa TaxID=6335 RepID=A0A0V1KWX9_9BILA|nr:hypothetical protein T02_2473 [Trichinella nativa]